MLFAENEALKSRLATQRQSLLDEIHALQQDLQQKRMRVGELELDLEAKDNELNKALKGVAIQRIPDVPKHTTTYVPDPLQVQRNARLAEELEIAIVVCI